MIGILREIAQRGADEILQVYNRSSDLAYSQKSDGSPLTEADARSHQVISSGLIEAFPTIPVLSEESQLTPWSERRLWERYFLVDPLDGTKEFLKRNGEFTINIALIEHGVPIAGVVHIPVSETVYSAEKGAGAYVSQRGTSRRISAAAVPEREACVAGSRSHAGEELSHFLAAFDAPRLVSRGSALKLCMVAEGTAHLYPRHGPTSHWDIAAGHCLIVEAGGFVCDAEGRDLRYGISEGTLNPPFVAGADARERIVAIFSASLTK